MISDTGSLRSQTDSHIIVLNEQHQNQQQQQQNNVSSNNNNNHHYAHNIASNFQSAIGSSSAASSTSAVNGSSDTRTIIDDDCFTANEYFRRRERLNEVRTLFYNCYSSTIGYKFKNGGDSATLGSLLGNFAEKVGLKTPI
jgi:myotubularin-related protein 14